jgi:hypothetical protein
MNSTFIIATARSKRSDNIIATARSKRSDGNSLLGVALINDHINFVIWFTTSSLIRQIRVGTTSGKGSNSRTATLGSGQPAVTAGTNRSIIRLGTE